MKIPFNYSLEIGRANTEVNIPDASISKKHGTFRFDTTVGELIFQDESSKFGTSVLIQRPLKLEYNTPTYVING